MSLLAAVTSVPGDSELQTGHVLPIVARPLAAVIGLKWEPASYYKWHVLLLQGGWRRAVGGGAGGLAALRRVAGRRGAAHGAAVGVRVGRAHGRGDCPHSACLVPCSGSWRGGLQTALRQVKLTRCISWSTQTEATAETES